MISDPACVGVKSSYLLGTLPRGTGPLPVSRRCSVLLFLCSTLLGRCQLYESFFLGEGLRRCNPHTAQFTQ